MGEGTGYTPFGGICLTDTFQLYEAKKKSGLGIGDRGAMRQNSERVNLQRKAPIMVILGNPPYSAGQKSANDNAQNLSYPTLDGRVADMYAKASRVNNKKSLYDTYVKAFRWASDRIGEKGSGSGVIAFVTSAGWLDGNAMDGMRKCLATEFSSVYVFNLRGNQRTSGEVSRKEGGKIFGSGSRAPIAITLLIKNPDRQGPAEIFYHDIGDYLSRERKLEIISERRDIFGPEMTWSRIVPNEAGDWLNQRSSSFQDFIPLGAKGKMFTEHTFFAPIYSHGLVTARDPWCYNYSFDSLKNNIISTIQFYNDQVKAYREIPQKNKNFLPNEFISYQSNKISWTRGIRNSLKSNVIFHFNNNNIITSQYRPFQKIHLYFDKYLNEAASQIPKLFPTSVHQNMVICVSGIAVTKDFSAIITNIIPDFELIGKSQCFPRYYYEKSTQSGKSLLAMEPETGGYVRRDGITDFILKEAKAKFGQALPRISKDQIFYYVYGLLHSQDYRTAFAADLKKMLPRLPLVESAEDFQAFSQAGKNLAKLHLNYETVSPYPGVKVTGAEAGDFRVRKMRFGNGAGGKDDRTVIHYNGSVKLSDIPLEAYEYVLNGKSPVDWVMDRYQVKTEKDSGITNDPNAWVEERGEPRYILDLLLRAITVSLETNTIVNSLPRLKFEA
jgi:predicted helicase